MFDPKIDAVAVFTGAPDHVRHVVEVMKRGKHCIRAVPAGLKYMMAETTYCRAPCILARELWQGGAEPLPVDVYEAIAMTAPGIVAMQSSRKGGQQLNVPSFDKSSPKPSKTS